MKTLDYNKSKIYKIFSKKTNYIYYGSTTTSLNKRLYNHKRGFINYMKKKTKIFVYSFYIFACDFNPQIELIENFPCNNKQELLNRERYYIINDNNSINKCIPLNTSIIKNYKQYHNKIYKEKNKNKISEYASTKILCPLCNLYLRRDSKSKHIKSKKHQFAILQNKFKSF